MAKQAWQKTKKKNSADIAKKNERAKIKMQQERYDDEVKNKGARYKRMAIMLIVLAIFSFYMRGSQFDVQTGGVLGILTFVCLLLCGVSWIVYARLLRMNKDKFRRLGMAILVVAVLYLLKFVI